ncbi:hypothetical protein PWT90_05467 [Aphanocladium album]|nr:hypothetical protein PWT90_05467 [Aphanocladium album]
MPPPPNAPTSPKAMSRARSFAARSSANAASPITRNDRAPLMRRASAPDGDAISSHVSTLAATPSITALCTPDPASAPAEPPIPPLRTLASAIFVPVAKLFPDDDVFEQSAALAETDRAEHMRQALIRSDKHAAAVRGNLLALFRRENARIMQAMCAEELAQRDVVVSDREAHERQLARQSGWTATDADMERMLASMAAPAPAPPPKLNQREQVAQILSGRPRRAEVPPDAIGDVPEPSFTHRAAASPRELAAREGLMLISKATTELRGYDHHIAAKRDMRRKALDRESAPRRRNVTHEAG